MSMNLCTVSGCDRKKDSKAGLCNMHYKRMKRNGTTDERVTTRHKLDKIADDYLGGWITFGCIRHPGELMSNGYGMTSDDGERLSSHVYVQRRVAGEAPEGKTDVAHSCKGKCVNPAHLSYKSHAENMADQLRDGTRAVGSKHGQTDLNEDDVWNMRCEYAAGGISMTKLGDKYGLTQPTVWALIHGHTWQHVAMPEDT
jgi:hypothetical protein